MSERWRWRGSEVGRREGEKEGGIWRGRGRAKYETVPTDRSVHGNMMLKHTAIDTNFYDPKTPGEGVKKSVFVVFFSGERSRQKIDKICESYGASKYTLPQDKEERSKLQSTVSEKKDDLKKVLDVTQEFQARKMSAVKDNIDDWYDYVMREKAIFVTLNMFNYDVTHKCLIAEGWCPEVLIAFRL